MDEFFKWPRLYVDARLSGDTSIALAEDQTHYLAHVLRRKPGDPVRIFNAEDGEWQALIQDIRKKSMTLMITRQIRKSEPLPRRIHVYFCPIKKQRQDWMIEKAVELGATDFHPVLSQNTEVRDINIDRITHQLTEASEQCERLEVPVLHPAQKLVHLLGMMPLAYPVYACVERLETPPMLRFFTGQNDIGFLIGPEGGFTSDEKNMLADQTSSISLGTDILRSETAALLMLSLLKSADIT